MSPTAIPGSIYDIFLVYLFAISVGDTSVLKKGIFLAAIMTTSSVCGNSRSGLYIQESQGWRHCHVEGREFHSNEVAP